MELVSLFYHYSFLPSGHCAVWHCDDVHPQEGKTLQGKEILVRRGGRHWKGKKSEREWDSKKKKSYLVLCDKIGFTDIRTCHCATLGIYVLIDFETILWIAVI